MHPHDKRVGAPLDRPRKSGPSMKADAARLHARALEKRGSRVRAASTTSIGRLLWERRAPKHQD